MVALFIWTINMRHWLFKSEPSCFSIDDLKKLPRHTTFWDGVRNYQARNMLRDEIKKGDLAFFYHSNATPPGIAGIMEIVKDGYPDFTAWDIQSEHFDNKSTEERPLWYMVDVRFVEKFKRFVSLEELKATAALKNMVTIRPGNRLSITPVTEKEWDVITNLSNTTTHP